METARDFVRHGPYIFKKADVTVLLCRADPGYIASLLPPGLRTFPCKSLVFCGFAQYPEVFAEWDPEDIYHYTESAILIPVRKKGSLLNLGLFVAYVYASDDRAVAAGREIYGYPKKQGETGIKTENKTLSITLNRLGRDLLELRGAILERRALSLFFNKILSLMPGKLLSIFFPKNFNYKFIPRVEGPGAEVREVTSTKLRINGIRRVALLKEAALTLQFKGSEADPLNKFASMPLKPLLAVRGNMDFTLPNGKKEYSL